jgi:putative aldouronate transport system permease protein
MQRMSEKYLQVSPAKIPVLWHKVWLQRYLFLMIVPFMGLVVLFSYVPIWGWLTAFQKYRPGKAFWQQTWVGLDNFIQLFQDHLFYLSLRNTMAMSLLGLIVGFTVPIAFAILLNELRGKYFKRAIQTISYLPHFVSWVVVAGIVYKMLSTDNGPINNLIVALGGQSVQFMATPKYFWGIVVASDLWKELGWNSIIYLSAIIAIDPALYEAARIDGAGRWRCIRHVTLPGISSTVIILLILSIGNFFSIGFEKQMLLGNPMVYDVSQVLDLYALRYGIGMNRFSFGTAINVVNSVVAIILLFSANGVLKRRTGESVM